MKVIAPPAVASFAREHGGRMFVWTKRLRCCAKVTFLQASSEPPDERPFRRVDAEGFELWLSAPGFEPPDELHLEVRGRRKPRVEAYWNGCVYAI